MRDFVPESPMYRVFTMEGLAARSMAQLSFTMLMLAIASGLALILGAVGLYGVLSYVVSRRAPEIAVRMALGAEAPRVRRMVVADGTRVTLAGVAIGLVAAFGLTRVLDTLLFGVGEPRHPNICGDVDIDGSGGPVGKLHPGPTGIFGRPDAVVEIRVAVETGGSYARPVGPNETLEAFSQSCHCPDVPHARSRHNAVIYKRLVKPDITDRLYLTASIPLIAITICVSACNPGGEEARGLLASCDDGDAAACKDLGVLTLRGEHVLRDWPRAAELFQQACDGGNAEGCVRLARMYVASDAENRGFTQDSGLAAPLLQRACDGGAMSGCTDLGDMYVEADSIIQDVATRSVTQDLVRAANLYQQACDGGELAGCTKLGNLYHVGKGVTTDPTRAFELYQQSCNGDDALGCAHLGELYATGLGCAAGCGEGREFVRGRVRCRNDGLLQSR